MKHGDILHFKAKGLQRLIAGFNPIRTALFIRLNGYDVVVMFEDGKSKFVTFAWFCKRFNFVSSRPEMWIVDPLTEVIKRLELKYKNEHIYFGELIGFSDFDKMKKDDILKRCIENGWLQ